MRAAVVVRPCRRSCPRRRTPPAHARPRTRAERWPTESARHTLQRRLRRRALRRRPIAGGRDASSSRRSERGASIAHRVEAVSRLAEIRVYQGRVDEAAELLSGYAGHVAAGRGASPGARGAATTTPCGRAELRRTVAQLVGDVTAVRRWWRCSCECELALDDLAAAADAARPARPRWPTTGEVVAITVLAEQARARVALASGDAATAVTELVVTRGSPRPGRSPLPRRQCESRPRSGTRRVRRPGGRRRGGAARLMPRPW